ncbi:MAG: putative glycolipid-binding domain-containing protein [Actinomycetota bacterium]|nr:putative glycolipid-binding domain-containing protein [Actinomycetota bacterium]
MSTPEAGQRVTGETGSTPTRRTPQATRMLAWAGVDGLRLEAARVVLGGRSMRASGSLVSARLEAAEAYSASYSLATDDAGVVQRLTVRTIRAQGEQYVSLTRSEEGIWLVDRVDQGVGTVRTHFGGALDVDLAFCALFKALPVRRLGLHRPPAHHGLAQHDLPRYDDLPMVFVSLPGLEVSCVRQTYRTVAVGESTVVSSAGDLCEVELTVDADGLVLEYPGSARRT